MPKIRSLAVAIVVMMGGLVACDDVGDLSGPSVVTADASITDATMDADGDGGSVDSREADVARLVPDSSVDPLTTLAARSPGCAACAADKCINYLHACSLIVGSATTGPAKGTPKNELCVETLACLLSTGCYVKPSTCYCRDDPTAIIYPEQCRPPTPDLVGPCKSILERSTEATDLDSVVAALTDDSKGAGWATAIIGCLRDNRCEECFTPGDAGSEGGGDGSSVDGITTEGSAAESGSASDAAPDGIGAD